MKKARKSPRKVEVNAVAVFAAMAAKCMDIKDVANKTGLSVGGINMMLCGSTTPRPKNFGKIAAVLGVPPEKLLITGGGSE